MYSWDRMPLGQVLPSSCWTAQGCKSGFQHLTWATPIHQCLNMQLQGEGSVSDFLRHRPSDLGQALRAQEEGERAGGHVRMSSVSFLQLLCLGLLAVPQSRTSPEVSDPTAPNTFSCSRTRPGLLPLQAPVCSYAEITEWLQVLRKVNKVGRCEHVCHNSFLG